MAITTGNRILYLCMGMACIVLAIGCLYVFFFYKTDDVITQTAAIGATGLFLALAGSCFKTAFKSRNSAPYH